MNYSLYRYAPLSTTALRQLVCALEGVVILQFWLMNPVVRTAVWQACRATVSALQRLTINTSSPQGVWLLMTALIVAAFGMLLLLRLLLPVATVAATTEADIERLLSEMDAPVDAVDVEG